MILEQLAGRVARQRLIGELDDLGHLEAGQMRGHVGLHAGRVDLLPGNRRTIALTFSPRSLSGTPITAASSISG